MFEILSLLGLGFILGLGHSLDPDHIVAVSTIVSKHKNIKKASFTGAFWGLGHTATLLIVGIIVLALKVTISETLSATLEMIVGAVIIGLGLSLIVELVVDKKHIHRHIHDGKEHIHIHSHKTTKKHNHSHKSFLVGALHGLAGSAALMILVLSTINNIFVGIIYILIFGLGSMVGMAFIGGLINIPFSLTSKKFKRTNILIKYSAGVFSIIFGILLIANIAKTF